MDHLKVHLLTFLKHKLSSIARSSMKESPLPVSGLSAILVLVFDIGLGCTMFHPMV